MQGKEELLFKNLEAKYAKGNSMSADDFFKGGGLLGMDNASLAVIGLAVLVLVILLVLWSSTRQKLHKDKGSRGRGAKMK